ncbi:MAG: protein kinase [Pseudomonadota bacterium]
MTAAHLSVVENEGENFADELPPGTKLLQGQYTITRFLSAGGFGITYLAKNSLDRNIVIKECFPAAFCRRVKTEVQARSRSHHDELTSIVRLFVEEARSLAKLVHPNIVGVHQVFEENNTAYMSLDFIEGRDLLDMLEDSAWEGDPAEVTTILRQILDAIKFVHAEGMLHRDISPDNILIQPDGNPILIDFGAAREQASKQSRVLSALRVVKDGYSPQEFYISGAEQTASSDLYALGATLYHVITRELPPDSQTRLGAVAGQGDDPYVSLVGRAKGYDRNVLRSIDHAMALMPKDRLQSAEDWLDFLDRRRNVVSRAVTRTVRPTSRIETPMARAPGRKRNSSVGLLLGSAAAIAVVAGIVATQFDLARFVPGTDQASTLAPAEGSTPPDAEVTTADVTPSFAAPLPASEPSPEVAERIAPLTPPPAADTQVLTETATALQTGAETASDPLDAPVAPTRSVSAPVEDTPPLRADETALTANAADAPLAAEDLAAVRPLPRPETPGTVGAEPATRAEPNVELSSASAAEAADFADASGAPVDAASVTAVLAARPADQAAASIEGRPQAPVTARAPVAPETADEVATAADATLAESVFDAVPGPIASASFGTIAPAEAAPVADELRAPVSAARTSVFVEQTLSRPAAGIVSAALPPSEAARTARLAAAPQALPRAETAEEAPGADTREAIVGQEVDLGAPEPEDAPALAASPTTERGTEDLPAPTLAAAPAQGRAAAVGPASNQSNSLVQSLWSVDLPFELDSGVPVVSVNGVEINALTEIEPILREIVSLSGQTEIPVAFGVRDPSTGREQEQVIVLPIIQKTQLMNGMVFETRFDGDVWKTLLVSLPGDSQTDLQPGDHLVAHLGTDLMIDGQTSLADALQAATAEGATSHSFAVQRNGQMWVSGFDYGADIAGN